MLPDQAARIDPIRPEQSDQTLQRIEELRRRRVIIYGAGKIGQRVHQALRHFGVRTAFFWDVNARLIGELDGTAVEEPDLTRIDPARRDDYVILVTIFSESVAQAVSDRLLEGGYLNIVRDRDLVNELLYLHCSRAATGAGGCREVDINICNFCPKITTRNSSCDIFSGHLMESMSVKPAQGEELFVIPSMGILTTTRCTLTCAGCNHLRDHFQPHHNFDISCAEIAADLDTLLGQVDMINKLVIVGGEAFLHPELEQILRHVLTLPRIGIIHMITNGTVMPKNDAIFSLLTNKRVIVEISGYGERIPVQLRERVAMFIDALARHRINHRHTQTMQWFDFGGFEERDYPQEQLRAVHASCCFVSNDLFNGRLYACSRSALGTQLGKIPDYPGDYVELRNTENSGLRERLTAFFNKRQLGVCRHCNGTSATTITAGHQAVRPSSQLQPAPLERPTDTRR